MGQFWRQLGLLLWKNLLLKRRKLMSAVVEILLPVAFLATLVVARHFSKIKTDAASFPQPFPLSIEIALRTWCDHSVEYCIAHPSKVKNMAIVEEGCEDVDGFKKFIRSSAGEFANLFPLMSFPTVADLDAYVKSSDYDTDGYPPVAAAVVFDRWGTKQNGHDWAYDLRVNMQDTPNTRITLNKFQIGQGKSWEMYYAENENGGVGFVHIQNLVDMFILANSTGMPTSAFESKVMLFPTPEHVEDNFQGIIQNVLPFLLILAFMFPFSRLVKEIVEEKEARLKESMRIMGLLDTPYWASWTVTYGCIFFITSLANTLMTTSNVFKYTNTGVLLIYFLSFSASIIAFAFLVSTFFSRAKLAGSLSMFLFFVTFIPYQGIRTDNIGTGLKVLGSLLAPTAFSLGSQNLGVFEASQQGVTFANWNEEYFNWAFSYSIWMMLIDTAVYLFLAWYFDSVFPTEYGSRKSYCFCLRPSFWCGDAKNDADYVRLEDYDQVPKAHKGMYEEVAPELLEELNNGQGVALRDVSRVFSTPDGTMTAVDELGLEMFHNQVFALLGHNGAGKTTTISMLTGMLEMSGGDAFIDGLSVKHDMRDIRTKLGFCPQHSIVFPLLTAYEHLQLFASLKGVPEEQVQEEAETLLRKVGLLEFRDVQARSMSGGMQRKLSVAIALIGDSKIVFLDEPTSGMDPYSRRATWELIKEYKKDRIIVLTTHYMDEADVLADRIGIMSHGSLKACGSSLYLKQCFGVGYTFVVSKSEEASADEIAQLVQQYVTDSELVSQVGTEIAFRVPFAASKEFPGLFEHLDQEGKDIGVLSYGVSVTTLEEVFIRVATESDQLTTRVDSLTRLDEQKTETGAINHPGTPSTNHLGKPLSIPLLSNDEANMGSVGRTNQPMFRNHFVALFLKRFHYAKRDRRAAVFQLVIPIIFLVLGLSVLQIPAPGPEPLLFTTAAYEHPLPTPYNNNTLAEQVVQNLPDPSVNYFRIDATDLSQFSHTLFAKRDNFQNFIYGGYVGNGSTYISACNTTATHSMPTYLNAMHTGMLRSAVGASAQIATTNSPLPRNGKASKAIAAGDGVIVSMMTIIAFAFIPASYATFIVREKQTKAKHQQLVSGVEINAYWCATYLWDTCNYLVPGVASALIILAFHNPDFVGSNYPTTVCAFFLYGTSIISFTYCFTHIFQKPGSAQNMLLIIYFASGLVLTILSFVLSNLDATKSTNKYLKFVYRLFPNFCLGDSLFQLSIRPFTDNGPWDLEVTGYNLIFMAVESVVYFFIAVMVDHLVTARKFSRLFCTDPEVPETGADTDEDVLNEKKDILSGSAERHPIVLEGLRKVYPGTAFTPPKEAVKDLWFSVPEGQCFGFLGVNGAGKTTTLSMMTGEFPPTSGNAYLSGFSILDQLTEARRRIGYCPQFDPLFDKLTGREHLNLYARIKGVRADRIPGAVNEMLKQLSLTEYADRHAGSYSGGNMRKLSVAIALIGSPPLVMLDEPSTGMDPVSRRFMWDFISRTMKGRAVILTTHSMEECEALCQRIGIMVSGRLMCLGTAQHLKEKFGQGFLLDIKTKTAQTAQAAKYVSTARQFVTNTFQGAELMESHAGSMRFKLPPQDMSLANLFRVMEENREACHIQQYAVSQTTLEQVFMYFARKQELEEQQRARGPAHAGAPVMQLPQTV